MLDEKQKKFFAETISEVLLILESLYFTYALATNKVLFYISIIIGFTVFYIVVINLLFYFERALYNFYSYLEDRREMRYVLKLPKLNHGRVFSPKLAKKIIIYLVAIFTFDLLFFAFPVVANRSIEEVVSPVKQAQLIPQVESLDGEQDSFFIFILTIVIILVGFLIYRFFEFLIYITLKRFFREKMNKL